MKKYFNNEQKYEYFPDFRDANKKLHIFRNARDFFCIYILIAATFEKFP